MTKNTIYTIIEKAESLGIKDTSQIKSTRSWWNGSSYEKRYRESIVIVFKSHIEAEFHDINYSLTCEKEIGKNWSCHKKEHLYIRFDINKEKNIVSYKLANTEIDVLVEVARAANNLRPMSWEQPISVVLAKTHGDYRVTFGTYASCAQSLTIRRDFDGDANQYSVIYGNSKYFGGCASIGGYTDTDKLYVVYEKDKWVSN